MLILNIILVFIITNVIILLLGLAYPKLTPKPSPIPETSLLPIYSTGTLGYGIDKLKLVYPDIAELALIRLLLETWNIPRICNDATLYREKSFEGYYVTIDSAGFRIIHNQRPWPPDEELYNIFVFGGSTTFGYGEKNARTIPSYLQGLLEKHVSNNHIAVYNFGHANYFSSQERQEFERLLKEGHLPDLALFIDGLNEFSHWDGKPTLKHCEEPVNLKRKLENMINCKYDELCLPIQRLARALDINADAKNNKHKSHNTVMPKLDDDSVNKRIIQLWLNNKKKIEGIATKYNIETLFIMQPVPGYAYDLKYHAFIKSLSDLKKHARHHWGYMIWEDVMQKNPEWTSNVINLSHLGEDNKEPIYVDRVHYTSAFMKEISTAITSEIVKRNIIK